MDNLIQSIVELADGAQELAREAERQYLAEVEDILKAQSRDSRRIERCLDGMLDSCFDNGMLVLFIKLCRYYFAIDPDATASYIQAYRDMWDEQAIEKPAKARLMGVTVKNSTNGEKLTQPRESCKGSKRTSLSSPGQWVHKWDCLCGRWQGH